MVWKWKLCQIVNSVQNRLVHAVIAISTVVLAGSQTTNYVVCCWNRMKVGGAHWLSEAPCHIYRVEFVSNQIGLLLHLSDFVPNLSMSCLGLKIHARKKKFCSNPMSHPFPELYLTWLVLSTHPHAVLHGIQTNQCYMYVHSFFGCALISSVCVCVCVLLCVKASSEWQQSM